MKTASQQSSKKKRLRVLQVRGHSAPLGQGPACSPTFETLRFP